MERLWDPPPNLIHSNVLRKTKKHMWYCMNDHFALILKTPCPKNCFQLETEQTITLHTGLFEHARNQIPLYITRWL